MRIVLDCMGIDRREYEYQKRDDSLSQTNVPEKGKRSHGRVVHHVNEHCEGVTTLDVGKEGENRIANLEEEG